MSADPMVELLVFLDRRLDEDASAWAVATLDEDGTVLSVTGPFVSAEAALVGAGEMDATRDRDLAEGEARVTHQIVPMWGPTS